jgi:hypothetical protein
MQFFCNWSNTYPMKPPLDIPLAAPDFATGSPDVSDPIGVVRQILMALIVWGLLVIGNQDLRKLSPKQIWRQLQVYIHRAVLEFGYPLGFKGAIRLLVE